MSTAIHHNSDNQEVFLNNEQILLQSVSSGDWQAYGVLFNHYLPKLSQYIFPFTANSREDTEEIIQEVFLKIWEKRSTLVVIRHFDRYLFRMAKNKIIDMLAGQKALRKKHQGYAQIKETTHLQPEHSLLYSQYYETAIEAIAGMSPKLRTTFLMSTEDEMSLDEIASSLDIPKETVKKRLYLANNFILDYLRTHADLIKSVLLFLLLIKK